MREEEELIADARRSQAETEQLREESGLGAGPEPKPDPPSSPLPEEHDPEPWAKTSSGDADSVTDDQ